MKSNLFKPMLACDADISKLKYPVAASAKLDGVRAVVREGVVYSRSNKPIPNAFVQRMFGHLEHYDGELIVGEPSESDVYRKTVSHVMSHDKVDFDVRFYVFDHVENMEEPWVQRVRSCKHNNKQVLLLKSELIFDQDELLAYEEYILALGFEGLILRSPNAPYKNGRSTMKEGYLLKLKRFTDAEFEIIGFQERERNDNEAQINELGYQKRSSHQDNKTGRNDLGALHLKLSEDLDFYCGTGFTDEERTHIWQNQDKYLGQFAKIKYFAIGMLDKPRHPVYLGLRNELDLSCKSL